MKKTEEEPPDLCSPEKWLSKRSRFSLVAGQLDS